MSEVIKSVPVSREIDELMSALVDAILAAKAGRFNILEEVGVVVKLLGDFAALPEEIRNNSGEAIEAVFLQASRLIAGLIGAPAGA